jgi:hypothetical protein
LPNHIGSSNNLAYPLPLTHPLFILLRGITNLPTNHPISFANYSYILTILLITIITPISYISYIQVPITFPLPFYFTTNLGDLQDTVSLNNNIIYYRKSTESWTMGNGPFFYGHYQLP